MKFLILNFFIKALLNATYEINPIDYSHKTVAHYNTYHTSITEWSILKPLITVLRTWYILPVHYISVQYSHSNSTPYMDTPNCPVMHFVATQKDAILKLILKCSCFQIFLRVVIKDIIWLGNQLGLLNCSSYQSVSQTKDVRCDCISRACGC